MLKSWIDENRLWQVPIRDKVEKNTDTRVLEQTLQSKASSRIYDLWSTEKIVIYLHAVLGFPTK